MFIVHPDGDVQEAQCVLEKMERSYIPGIHLVLRDLWMICEWYLASSVLQSTYITLLVYGPGGSLQSSRGCQFCIFIYILFVYYLPQEGTSSAREDNCV